MRDDPPQAAVDGSPRAVRTSAAVHGDYVVVPSANVGLLIYSL